MLDEISKNLCPASHIDHNFECAAQQRLKLFHYEVLKLYQRELRDERGRRLFRKDLDYQSVRDIDHELETVTRTLHEFALRETDIF